MKYEYGMFKMDLRNGYEICDQSMTLEKDLSMRVLMSGWCYCTLKKVSKKNVIDKDDVNKMTSTACGDCRYTCIFYIMQKT